MGARLARYTGNKTYSDWAEKAWDWVYDIGYINHDTWAIYDGGYTETNCTKYNLVQYSYNNAIFAYGAAFMFDVVSLECRSSYYFSRMEYANADRCYSLHLDERQ